MMHPTRIALILAAFAFTLARAQEPPKMPEPQKEHQWLQQFVGEWNTEAECVMAPGQPPVKCKGTESVRTLGGFWIVTEGSSMIMEMPIKSVMTLGYDPLKKKYVGTWIDSCNNHLWNYTGALEGNRLTLETEGPNPMLGGKLCKFKEVMELKSKDHKTFTSSMQGDDGKWITFMTANSHRKS